MVVEIIGRQKDCNTELEYINSICVMLGIISEHRIESNAMPTIKHYTVTNVKTITDNQPTSLYKLCTI